ncbi:hypothetical protein [Pseudaestuariivita rosea]|uniref:hypothetical protein n=1 Tax=Pseudaestuariivita rosea TaxID=2763263 RepID=UPI001ABB3EB0|nr:hypothetical protein [Pseudaestuariivita rosea]
MSRMIMTLCLAIGFALTGAAQAAAEPSDEDIARLLSGFFGKEIRGDDDDDRRREAYWRYDDDRRDWRDDRRKVLPHRCFRTYETRDGLRRGFARRCLNRHYDHADRLPRNCLSRARTINGKRHYYKARCLRNEGYRIGRSRY